jgi:hypothetical protein
MHLRIPLISRFFAAQRQDAGNTPPTVVEHVHDRAGSIDDSGASSNDAPDGDLELEIPDHEEDSDCDPIDWEAISTASNASPSPQLIISSSIEISRSPCNVPASKSSDTSNSRPVVPYGSLKVWSDEDDDESPAPIPTSRSSYGASISAWKHVLSDPRSSIWKGRNGARLAVVVLQDSDEAKESSGKELVLRQRFVPESKVITEAEGRTSTEESMSNGWRKIGLCNRGGGFEISRSLSVWACKCN